MKFCCIPHGLALATALALSASGAFAANELHALSETEMSAVYGRGLSEPTLTALTTQEQGNSAVAVSEALSALGAMSGDGAQDIDRQMAQQRQQAATGVQANLKIAQTMASLSNALAPLGGGAALPMMPFPLPVLPSLDAVQKKH
jgi:hypothetical protein